LRLLGLSWLHPDYAGDRTGEPVPGHDIDQLGIGPGSRHWTQEADCGRAKGQVSTRTGFIEGEEARSHRRATAACAVMHKAERQL